MAKTIRKDGRLNDTLIIVPRRMREFERFIGRVRRRFVFLRLLERTGLGVVCACAAAAPLLGIALWRGQEALPIALAALGVGAVGGFFWGIVSRPGELEAALEADRQLDWADLLASAWSVRGRHDDPWSAAVALAADERCRCTSPGAVMLSRLGVRAWGGIALAAVLVLALGLFPRFSNQSQAQNALRASSGALLNPHSDESTAAFPRPSRRTAVQPEPEDAMNGRFSDGRSAAADSQSGRQNGAGNERASGQKSGSSETSGAGSSHTDVTHAGSLPQPRRNTGSAATGREGAAGTGAGNPSTTAAAPADGAGVASDDPTAGAVPPWRAADWPRNVRRAHQAMDSGQIPDQYRDVLRGYFDRDR